MYMKGKVYEGLSTCMTGMVYEGLSIHMKGKVYEGKCTWWIRYIKDKVYEG